MGDIRVEPTAITGMACRLPGQVRSASDLFRLLIENKSGQCAVPSERFNVDAFYHPNGGSRPGSMNMKAGYFIQEDVRYFDNGFFGINNIEATYMDPQQRKLLEVVYECFESAGETLENVQGANIGVYCGNFATDFELMQCKDPEYFHRYHATGKGLTLLANRISYTFDLRGPSVVLDTACSSSLYALHVACTALDAGECDAAIVTGTNLIQSPEQHLSTMKAGVLSATSTCHTFDACADGYGRGEGVGAIYLTKLNRAFERNDPIRAVIRGTAVNCDGKTNGITLPSGDAQEAAVRKAYQKAGLDDFDETSYVECHGTGTPVGDPVEIEGLSRVFRREEGKSPLYIGSIKPNLGHSEAASALSSVFKVALALENQLIPATIGVQNINPSIKLNEKNMHIVTENMQWPETASSRQCMPPIKRASVNSFGYGGANAHAILESAMSRVPPSSLDSDHLSKLRSAFLLPLSANNRSALESMAQNMSSADLKGLNVVDLAYTLGERRTKHTSRGYYVGSQSTIQEDLEIGNFRLTRAETAPVKLPVGFIFTGQGSQWAQMGKELLEEFPGFRKSIASLDSTLQKLPHPPSFSLIDIILEPIETNQINQVQKSQPCCTAIQVALVQLLHGWGINPAGVVGHSSGEIAAAYAAGFISAREAITIAYYRGYAVERFTDSSSGAMLATAFSQSAAELLIGELDLASQISVACVNSPESVTISGDVSAIDRMHAYCQSEGHFSRKLLTDGRAYHSHHIAAIGREYDDLLHNGLAALPQEESPRQHADWVSSLTGESVHERIIPSYWRQNAESRVLFSHALESLMKDKKLHLIEIGPHAALQMPVKQIMRKLGKSETDFQYSTLLVRKKHSVRTILAAMGELFLCGHDIDFGRVNYVQLPEESDQSHKSQGKVIPDLPPYPWTYDNLLWSEPRASLEFRNRRYARHELLGSQVPGANAYQTIWRNLLSISDVPWIQDHKLGQEVVFPGAGYIAMAIEAARQIGLPDATCLSFRQTRISKALMLSTDSREELITCLRPVKVSSASVSDSWFEFEISSVQDGASTLHASGRVGSGQRGTPIHTNLSFEPPRSEPRSTEAWYNRLGQIGMNFGPYFQSISQAQSKELNDLFYSQASVKPLKKDLDGVSEYIVHPITIDAMFQAALHPVTSEVARGLTAKVPVAIDSAQFYVKDPQTEESELFVNATSRVFEFGSAMSTCELRNPDVVAQISDLQFVTYQAASQDETLIERHPILRGVWKPDVSKYISSDPATLEKILLPSSDISNGKSHGQQRLLTLVELHSHKDPRLRVLILNEHENTAMAELLLEKLQVNTLFRRCSSLEQGNVSETGDLFSKAIQSQKDITATDREATKSGSPYDLIILSPSISVGSGSSAKLPSLKRYLNPGGVIIGVIPESKEYLLPQDSKFTSIGSGAQRVVLCGYDFTAETAQNQEDIILIAPRDDDHFKNVLKNEITKRFAREVRDMAPNEITHDSIRPGDIVISTLELQRPYLTSLDRGTMSRMKALTDNARTVLWITGQWDTQPEFSLVGGLCRTLRVEQPNLRFVVVSTEFPDGDHIASARNIVKATEETLKAKNPDTEFLERDGIVYINRFQPDAAANEAFQQRQGGKPIVTALGDIKPVQLSIEAPGQFDTLSMVPRSLSQDDMPVEYVELEVKSVGLNAKNIYAFAGKLDVKNGTSAFECCGIVTKVGRAVSGLAPGDRVLSMALCQLSTVERVPAYSCVKLLENEPFHSTSTLPTVYATAIYGLCDRANLQAGETVLIHSAAGGVGIAAIQIARLRGAEIFGTVGTEEKKSFLVNEFGLKPENIFSSRDLGFVPGIMAATKNRGVDVVLNSLTGEFLHESWRLCAKFGRFVEIGKYDLLNYGKLDMQVFLRSASFIAFDLAEVYSPENPSSKEHHSFMLRRIMELYRTGQIRSIEPLKVFDISQAAQAFRHFSSSNRIGKVTLSFENDRSQVKTPSLRYYSSLSPNKTYLMIGCLGGLGRSLSKWMLSRGCKRFVFLGRSGIDKDAAAALVHDLRDQGANVVVVRGSVENLDDVKTCFESSQTPIGGVIHAAMGLNEALWTSMSSEAWHAGIAPKAIGAWNLHHALQGQEQELEFFLMTSSISGSIGAATESNYCAANCFLDNFARYRRSLGLQATSIGLGMISEVGYVHENPEVEQLLLRKGIQPIGEAELLQIFDIAISHPPSTDFSTRFDPYASSHLITGLEPFALRDLRAKGLEIGFPTAQDPRASLLEAVLDGDDSQQAGSNASSYKDANGNPIPEAVVSLIKARLSSLILQPEGQVHENQPLSKFGLDSMLASELRTWLYRTFEVDISFLLLLSNSMTISRLGDKIVGEVGS